MDSPPPVDSPERLERRRVLRQQTVENHRLLRRLGDEEETLAAEIAALREQVEAATADDDAAASSRAREMQAQAEARLATVRSQTAETRERASAVKLEASGLLEAALREEELSSVPTGGGSGVGAADAPAVSVPNVAAAAAAIPGDIVAQRAMARTNRVLHREICADMRAFLREHPACSVEEWAAQSEWARDTGGARDERGLSLRVREGDWKRLFEEAALDPEREGGAALDDEGAEEEGGGGARAVVGRRYRCLARAAATAELDADAADPALSFQL